MRVEPAKVEDIRLLDLRPQETERFNVCPRLLDGIAALIQMGISATLIHDGVILAIVGYFELWPGVYEIWALPSKHVVNHPMVYLRTVKQYILAIERQPNVMRLQTTAIADALHDRWMSFLGFTCETPNGMKNYSVLGHTFNMWSKTYGGQADER